MVNALQLMAIMAPCMADTLAPRLATALPALCDCVRAAQPRTQDAAVAAVGAVMGAHHVSLLPALLSDLLPMLDSPGGDCARLGAVRTVQAVAKALGLALARYCLLLAMPVLQRMTDSVEDIRQAAAQVWWRWLVFVLFGCQWACECCASARD